MTYVKGIMYQSGWRDGYAGRPPRTVFEVNGHRDDYGSGYRDGATDRATDKPKPA